MTAHRRRTTRSSAKTCARGSTCSRRSRTSGSARSRSGCASTKAARTIVDGEPAPDRNDEYRFYQVLLGAWPADVARLQAYMTKAVKEGKQHSSWINPNEEYEAAVATFVERVLAGPEAAKFLPAFQPFQDRVARCGLVNSLAQTVLKIASPGVPDFYQGSELWDLNLVDPDNRRPVDFAAAAAGAGPHRRAPGAARGGARRRHRRAAGALAGRRGEAARHGGRPAAARRRRPALFLDGDYLPLDVETTVDARVVAFARMLGRRRRRHRDRAAPGVTAGVGRASRPARRPLAHVARPPAEVARRAHLPRRLHGRGDPPGDRW